MGAGGKGVGRGEKVQLGEGVQSDENATRRLIKCFLHTHATNFPSTPILLVQSSASCEPPKPRLGIYQCIYIYIYI